MATQVITDVQNYYGSAGWTGSATNRQIGNGFAIRLRFTTPLVAMGDITNIHCSFNKVSTGIISGSAYVTTNVNLTPRQTSSMYYIGEHSAASGAGTKTFNLTSLNGNNFKTGIGTASTWYLILTCPATSIYYWTTTSSRSTWTITYNEPYSIRVNAGGTWRSGEPWVNVGGTWRKGTAYINVGGTWRKGT